MTYFLRWLHVMIIVFGVSLAWAEPEIKGTSDELKLFLKNQEEVVVLSAEATFEVQADRATVMISVISEKEKLEEALKDNYQLRQGIFQKLTAAAIPRDRIAGTRFSSTPQYGIFSKRTKSYKVENLLKVTIENEAEFQKVAGIIDSSDNIHYRKLSFEHQDKEALELKALSKAFDNLEKKKALFENRLSLKLTPKRFHDQHVSENSQARRLTADKAWNKDMISKTSEEALSKADPEENTTIFGALTFQAMVSVEYLVTRK